MAVIGQWMMASDRQASPPTVGTDCLTAADGCGHFGLVGGVVCACGPIATEFFLWAFGSS